MMVTDVSLNGIAGLMTVLTLRPGPAVHTVGIPRHFVIEIFVVSYTLRFSLLLSCRNTTSNRICFRF